MTSPNADKEAEKSRSLIYCHYSVKKECQFLTKLNICLPYNPATAFLGIYLREMKPYIHIKTCTQMFTKALFVIANY